MAHLFACVWVKLGRYEEKEGWVPSNGDKLEGEDDDILYNAALYWLLNKIILGYLLL